MKILVGLLFSFTTVVVAQTPAILLEACNKMEAASKRLECLRAATGVARQSPAPQPFTRPASIRSISPSMSRAAPTTSGQTCFVGPRGGTYTITASGKKNYGGC